MFSMHDSQKLAERIVKGSSIVILFTFLASPLGYFIRVMYSRTLSIEMFGLFYAIMAILGVFTIFNDLGFGYSISYFVPKYLKKKKHQKVWNLYKYNQIVEVSMSVVISIILILSSKWLASNYFKVPGSENILYIFIIYFISNSFLSSINKFFTGLQQEVNYSSIMFTRLLLSLVFSVLFLLFDSPNVLNFAISWAVANIATALIYNFLLHKKNKLIARAVTWDKRLFQLMLNYAVPTLLATSLHLVIVYTDTLLLTLFRNLKEVGIYNIVFPLATVSGIFISPLNKLFLPLVSHLMEGQGEKVALLTNTILKIIPLAASYFALFIMMFPSSLVALLFGQKWVGFIETPVIIFSFGYIISLVSSYLTTVVNGIGKVRQRLKISSFIVIVNVALSVKLISMYGVIGAVIANSVVYLLSIILMGKIIKSEIPFSYPILYYARLLIIGVVIFSLVRLLRINPVGLYQILLAGFIYTLFFSMLALLLKLVNKDIWNVFLSNLKTIRVKNSDSRR